MINVSRPRDDRERAKTLAQQGFSVERVTGIEPAWSAWKASGTRSRVSVKMAVDLPVSVFDLDRCGPCLAPFYRPYGPAKDPLCAFVGPRRCVGLAVSVDLCEGVGWVELGRSPGPGCSGEEGAGDGEQDGREHG